jgi:hypothetical protein
MWAGPEWHAHVAAARDGDVHLAYQVVGHNGPDLLFVPTASARGPVGASPANC